MPHDYTGKCANMGGWIRTYLVTIELLAVRTMYIVCLHGFRTQDLVITGLTRDNCHICFLRRLMVILKLHQHLKQLSE